MAIEDDLSAAGVPYPLAAEILNGIRSGSTSAQALVGVGLPAPAARELAAQINGKAGVAHTLTASGFPPVASSLIRTLINSGTGGGGLIRTNAKIRDAYAAYKAGTRNMVIVGVGSSTVRGWLSGNGTTNVHINGWLNKMAASLNAKGEFARNDALFGNGSADLTNTDLVNRDPRVALSGNWYTDATFSAGGRRLRATAAGAITFNPQMPFDRLREYHQTFTSTGTATLSIDGGAGTTINRNTGVDAIAAADFTVPLATHSISLAWGSGSFGNIGFRPFRSDRREIEFINFGAAGGDVTTSSFDPTSSDSHLFYKGIDAIGQIDVGFIATGGNELANSKPIATMTARVQYIGEQMELKGAAPVIVLPFATAVYAARNGAAYVQALRDLAASKGWDVLDFNTLFGPFNASAPYEAGDDTHKNDLGHSMMNNLAMQVVFGMAA